MALTAIYAQLNCSDLGASTAWFSTLFARQPDARPMQGLAEWHHGREAGFQLYENPQQAGSGTLTLLVDDIRSEQERLGAGGVKTAEIETADYTTIMRLNDPDGNLVVLAQPGRG
ncbi:glyoxalase/bleomycin resistance/dioxygenase family protein [Rhizobium sp. LjRoot30]|uniref:VOC family protein n=1 Tax=Rhizobium sp. LjRoot30 TaxID=3342320 RepID=UPI003ED1047F